MSARVLVSTVVGQQIQEQIFLYVMSHIKFCPWGTAGVEGRESCDRREYFTYRMIPLQLMLTWVVRIEVNSRLRAWFPRASIHVSTKTQEYCNT